MSMLEKYKEEIRRAGLYDSDSDYGGMLGNALEKLVSCHCEEGHSGFSHSYVINLFYRLMKTDLLTPLTGEADEWRQIGEENGNPLYQNIRRSSVFKTGDDVYDIEGGPVFETPSGSRYTCRESTLHGIKFPYMPPLMREIVKVDE